MRRFIALFVVLGLLLPFSSSACTTLHLAQSPFAQASFKNDAPGTVSAIPVQESSNAGLIRTESRHSVIGFSCGEPVIRPDAFFACSRWISAFKTHPVFHFRHGLPADCGLTPTRLARADH